MTLARTARGWTVLCPSGASHAGDLVEGLTLADLVAEELGTLIEPDRTARRSARGPGPHGEPAEDPVAGRTAALERTVAQLEHALAARVSTERAIGVLAERNRTSPRAAFESLRQEARSSGRPLADLAREVLSSLEEHPGAVAPVGAEPGPAASQVQTAPPAPRPAARTRRRPATPSPVAAAADGGS
ncbi:MAG: ANTAR domain-containing protein [Actinomycetes bacterium]